MELNETTMDQEAYNKYERATKKVRYIKGFYTNLRVFIILNIIFILGTILVRNYIDVEAQGSGFERWLFWNTLLLPILWGIGLFFHWFFVFHGKINLFKNWEERKIKEFLEKEEDEIQNFNEQN